MPIRPVSMMFCRPNARLLPARSGSRTVRFVFDVDKPGLVALWRHLDRPVATGRGHQPKRARLEEVDRLFVEEGKYLGLGGLAGFGENVSQLLHGFDLAHDCDLVSEVGLKLRKAVRLCSRRT